MGNVALTLKDSDFDILKPGFVQWMNEIRNSVSYTNLVRKSFNLCTGWENGNQHFDSPEALLDALAPVPLADGLTAGFYGNDFYANRYSLVTDTVWY